MKRVLITGANSYIGTSFQNYISKFSDEYMVDVIDVVGEQWKQASFVGYDVIYHVAGIAHADNGKISKEREELYYSVNTNLTIEIAKKAKNEGVKQFIFMSSALVYGQSARIGRKKIITKQTPVSPINCYGNSKVLAEKGLIELETDEFKIVVLRCPMIYGKGSKGNYQTLVKFAKKLKFFPYVKNQRSMLYVGNLVEFVRLIIKNQESGVFWPQNSQYSNTSEMVRDIGKVYGKKVILIKGFGWLLKIMALAVGMVNKAFGNLTYDMEMSEYKEDYRLKSLTESIIEAEQ